MNVDGLEINDINVGGRKKQVVVGVIVAVVLIIIFIAAISMVKPQPLSVKFTDSKIKPGSSTKLVVIFKNMTPKDMHNVTFTVTPEDKNISVSNNDWVEQTIGAGAYRTITFPISVSGNLTQGTYRITVNVKAGQTDYKKNVYLEITS